MKIIKYEYNQTILLPQSFPTYAIHAKAVRLSVAAFNWLKKSDRLPSVIAFAFVITSFNGLRNSANPARSGFYNIIIKLYSKPFKSKLQEKYRENEM